MWVSYKNIRLNVSSAYKIVSEEENKINIHYWNGHIETLTFESKEERDVSFQQLEKDVIRAAIKIKL